MTLEQRRAAHALRRVEDLSAESKEFRKSYRSYVDRLGPMIVTNGLGQALATERASAGPNPEKDDARAHAELYAGLQDWLGSRPDGAYQGAKDLLQAIVRGDQAAYVRAQAEALAWLEWHKKFCRAAFPSGGEGEA